jgi:hypothetical protein
LRADAHAVHGESLATADCRRQADYWSAMPHVSFVSEYRVQKRRVEATLTLTTGQSVRGHFFLGETSMSGEGPERVDDLLNGAHGFLPFERLDDGPPRIVLYNAALVAVVALNRNEAREVPGYEVARVRRVALLLSTGAQVVGAIRVYLPPANDRVSDWARDPGVFRYLETPSGTLLVNIHHVAEVVELESK